MAITLPLEKRDSTVGLVQRVDYDRWVKDDVRPFATAEWQEPTAVGQFAAELVYGSLTEDSPGVKAGKVARKQRLSSRTMLC